MFKKKFDANKAKVNLKLLTHRLVQAEQKKTNLSKQKRREIAGLLQKGKDESARILVEHIIREDFTVEAYELLRMYVDLLLARFNVFQTEEKIKEEISESIGALTYCAWLMSTELPELKVLLEQFTIKYGKPFTDEITNNKENYVNPRLLAKLNIAVPDPELVTLYLVEIAKAHQVEWTPPEIKGTVPTAFTLPPDGPSPVMPAYVPPVAQQVAQPIQPPPAQPAQPTLSWAESGPLPTTGPVPVVDAPSDGSIVVEGVPFQPAPTAPPAQPAAPAPAAPPKEPETPAPPPQNTKEMSEDDMLALRLEQLKRITP